MKDKKGLKFWVMVVIAVAAVIYLGLKIWNQPAKPSGYQFKGPTGPPHMKGPSGPPPGGN